MKIKIKNKLEGSKKSFNLRVKLKKKQQKKTIRIKLDKTIHTKFGLKDEIENQ